MDSNGGFIALIYALRFLRLLQNVPHRGSVPATGTRNLTRSGCAKRDSANAVVASRPKVPYVSTVPWGRRLCRTPLRKTGYVCGDGARHPTTRVNGSCGFWELASQLVY